MRSRRSRCRHISRRSHRARPSERGSHLGDGEDRTAAMLGAVAEAELLTVGISSQRERSALLPRRVSGLCTPHSRTLRVPCYRLRTRAAACRISTTRVFEARSKAVVEDRPARKDHHPTRAMADATPATYRIKQRLKVSGPVPISGTTRRCRSRIAGVCPPQRQKATAGNWTASAVTSAASTTSASPVTLPVYSLSRTITNRNTMTSAKPSSRLTATNRRIRASTGTAGHREKP